MDKKQARPSRLILVYVTGFVLVMEAYRIR